MDLEDCRTMNVDSIAKFSEQDIVRLKNMEGRMELVEKAQIVMLHFPMWDRIPYITHGISTRQGGVSGGIYKSMNFKEDGEDTEENVRENYRRIAKHLGCDVSFMVRPSLVHGDRVHRVTATDYGNGTVRRSTLFETDALITDTPGVTLCATFADCVPLLFLDTKKHAVGLAHSGWRGTVKKIGKKTVEAMGQSFGSRPEDILAAVGPCICQGCYEVGEDTAEEFRREFLGAQELLTENPMKKGHYQLDLRKANETIFLESGILPEHILVSDLCTCCNPKLIFSHRATQGKRGAIGAFLGLQG